MSAGGQYPARSSYIFAPVSLFYCTSTVDVHNRDMESNTVNTAATETPIAGGRYLLIDRTSGVREEITATDMAAAIEQAKAWTREASWDTSEGTVWVTTTVVDMSEQSDADDLDLSAEGVEDVRVTIDPLAPCCTADEHEWDNPHSIVGGIKENPGVWGHGGGIVMHEVCLHCGCERVTDTWAQDHETGEQGLTSVRYEPGKYADEVEALRAPAAYQVALPGNLSICMGIVESEADATAAYRELTALLGRYDEGSTEHESIMGEIRHIGAWVLQVRGQHDPDTQMVPSYDEAVAVLS